METHHLCMTLAKEKKVLKESAVTTSLWTFETSTGSVIFFLKSSYSRGSIRAWDSTYDGRHPFPLSPPLHKLFLHSSYRQSITNSPEGQLEEILVSLVPKRRSLSAPRPFLTAAITLAASDTCSWEAASMLWSLWMELLPSPEPGSLRESRAHDLKLPERKGVLLETRFTYPKHIRSPV